MILTPNVDYTVNGVGQYVFTAAYVGKQVSIQYQAGTTAQSALAQLGMSMATGAAAQPVWGYLSTNYPAQALGYSGISYLYAAAYDLGSDATVENHSFEVSTPFAVTAGGDANPASVALDLLTNQRYGANFPASRVGDTSAWANYALAANLVCSPVLNAQKAASEWLAYLLQLSNTDCVWSQGQLKFVPLGDAACTANGASYTPNNTAVYDLTEDHFLIDTGDEDLLKAERKSDDDTYNHVRVEFCNRANQYNTEIVEARDAADIDRRGLRTKDVVEAHAICDSAVAANLAALLLQRELAVRATYRPRVPWTFALLEPLDLLTLTVAGQGTRVPVRINKITETDSGSFELECEDCPIGMASAPAYGVQAGSGFAHDYNAVPGSVAQPFFFEPPVQLTTTGLEVWVAVTGQKSTWGGCRVWASNDGLSYKEVGRVMGGARYGALSAALGTLTSNTLSVALKGQGGAILSGSAADAANNQTLVFVGDGISGEYLDYVTATLTGTNAYNLTTLTRGAYYTTPTARNANQATVVRVDAAIAKSDPLLTSQVGSPLYFKFTSFNIYGGAEESLASVPQYSYTPLGYMLKLPPPAVSSLTFDGVNKFSWPAVTYPRNLLAGYRLKFQYGTNQSWSDAVAMNSDVITDSPYVASIVPQTLATFMVRAVDIYGNESATSAISSAQLGDPAIANLLQSYDYKANSWPGTTSGGTTISGGNLVATNSAAAFGTAAQAAFSAIASDPAFSSSYPGISYTASAFSPAKAGRLTLLHTVVASQYQVNYRPVNPAPAFSGSGTQAAFPQGSTAAAFAGKPDWSAWPGSVQASVQPYEFQVVCGAGATSQQITRLTAQVDTPDVNLKLTGVSISSSGSRLTGAIGKFTTITNINLTVKNDSTAIDAQFTDRDATLGPNVVGLDVTRTQVACTVDALIQGYYAP